MQGIRRFLYGGLQPETCRYRAIVLAAGGSLTTAQFQAADAIVRAVKTSSYTQASITAKFATIDTGAFVTQSSFDLRLFSEYVWGSSRVKISFANSGNYLIGYGGASPSAGEETYGPENLSSGSWNSYNISPFTTSGINITDAKASVSGGAWNTFSSIAGALYIISTNVTLISGSFPSTQYANGSGTVISSHVDVSGSNIFYETEPVGGPSSKVAYVLNSAGEFSSINSCKRTVSPSIFGLWINNSQTGTGANTWNTKTATGNETSYTLTVTRS